jgi:CBS domain-containing protein
MSTDVVTCGPDASLRTAGRRMLDADIGSVVVVDDGVPMGILTGTDVANHYGAFVREAHELDERRDDWEERRWDPGEVP